MTLRPAEHHASGIRTYYVGSDSKPGTEYAVQHIRKPGMNRWQCSCPQFFYRCVARRRHCKHIRFVRLGSGSPIPNAAEGEYPVRIPSLEGMQ